MRAKSPSLTRKREPLESQDNKRAKHGVTDADFSRRDARGAAIQEAFHMKEWLSKEDDFVLKQAKKRAAIRVRESRAKPIDFLAVNLRFVDAERDPADENELEEVEVTPKNPSVYLKTLHLEELDELYGDLEEFYKLETNRSNKGYWRALLAVCKAQRKISKASKNGRDLADNPVSGEINKILLGKSVEQLIALESSINKKLDSTEPIDVDYWEDLYRAVRLKKAWLELDRMFILITKAAEEESKRKQVVFKNGKRQALDAPARYKLEEKPEASNQLMVRSTEKEFESAAARLYKQEANHELEEDEELFNREADVPTRVPKWKSKLPNITPMKPKYFNRVQTGFEWNTYNKVHYNEENLPPKVVWGYRFNIFYPDLLDHTKAPTYKIEKPEGQRNTNEIQEDMSIIRFSAGAPYEDVCFQIVDKDWDHSSRYDRGFKSSFDKGILQLHFKFKRVNYKK
ncbi:Putative uncharacterized protein [Taphrina deformans PYCC 5710]|uniref:Splicing factor Cactin n=1 Tax=Taphrina deformans (strain PYCC 5710 / ATCC 11124 / CBS 356.35 / IMI 108563 / JCM 9778 / NBRC 8474) TaxID=1097556 RepID=R4X9H0_TAPDE|nr:Putative uncharacterized protein [Taphrina deformans PYCC 5710]|eukprot:CCG82355.1 Putative uncharacterized protein [Taphrina deformans PYCC 5710]